MDDIKKLQGTWNIASLEVDGAKQPDGAFQGAQITIKGDSFTTTAMGDVYSGTFSVDASATPKTIDMHFADGPEKGNTSLGIYDIEGDSWRLCLTVTGKTRPRAFATSPGSGLALETLVKANSRSKPKVRESKSDAGSAGDSFSEMEFAAVPELQGEWSMVSGVRDGFPLDKMMVSSAKRVVHGCETTVSFGGKMFLQARIKVDKSKHPHEIDYYNTAGMNAGAVQLGIYEVDGNLLKLIYAAPGAARPSSFATEQGDGLTFTIWKK